MRQKLAEETGLCDENPACIFSKGMKQSSRNEKHVKLRQLVSRAHQTSLAFRTRKAHLPFIRMSEKFLSRVAKKT